LFLCVILGIKSKGFLSLTRAYGGNRATSSWDDRHELQARASGGEGGSM